MRELSSGTVVDGRYTIVKRLGSGGMADVYCAEDNQLGRRVALKVLYARFAEDDEFVERFRREASSAAGLQHQHVVSVYDRGEWEGTSYIAMEFVDGRTLKQIITAEAPMDPVRSIDLAVQVLKAARFAHRRGVIHRDLKPHNVIVEEGVGGPNAKVADFGIARAGASDMTQTGSIMGTAQYLSPEQAQGHAVTPQSDLYSIGICLYEMLTGRIPFDGESAVTIALKQVNETPVPPSHYNATLPAPLEDAVLRALAKDPAERFPDADAFIVALEDAKAQIEAGHAPPVQNTAPFTAVAAAPIAPAVAPAPLVAEEVVYTEPPPEREGMGWGWALLIAALVVAAIVGALFLTGTIGAAKTRVPNVIGISDAAAKVKLNRAGLEIDITQVVSDKPKGIVINQHPSFGSKVKEGTVVSVSVSAGPGDRQVPPVDGLSRREARRILTKAGFKIHETTEESTDVDKGKVIRTEPDNGSQLEIGSTVELIVSSGPPDVEVPDVTGKSLDEARAELEDANFKVKTVDQETGDADPGTVLTQSPSGGTAPEGSDVTLTVARAPSEADVPDVVGETSADAFAILQDAGFKVVPKRTTVTDPTQDDVVLGQDPAGGKKAKPGDTVTIEIGNFDDSSIDPEPGTETTPSDGTTTVPGAR
ncbi:MAG: Stk1 family PASTA domain-containing Ser/Thr kinase [Solirubrobacteraceae bacterium]